MINNKSTKDPLVVMLNNTMRLLFYLVGFFFLLPFSPVFFASSLYVHTYFSSSHSFLVFGLHSLDLNIKLFLYLFFVVYCETLKHNNPDKLMIQNCQKWHKNLRHDIRASPDDNTNVILYLVYF